MELFPPVKPTLLIVDDSAANLSLLSGLLRPHYTVKAVNHGAKALEQVSLAPPDLILLDIMMPDIDGYDVCRRLKADAQTRPIPIIFLTSKTESMSEALGMTMGAVDYISYPINPAILLSRVGAHLVQASHARQMRVNNEYLEFEVAQRVREFTALKQVTVLALASLAEVRDRDTGNHLLRTQNYVRCLGWRLRERPRFARFLSDHMIDMMFKCAPLHDIGKVGIPDRILLKPGRLDAQEREIMKTHTTLGRDALLLARKSAGESFEFLEVASQIVYSHHEKWDGSGYPQGLVGDAIPIPARLMALADVYDSLISSRVYKPGISHAQACDIIVAGRGQHFDPDVVDAFLASVDEFQAIALRYSDTAQDLDRKAASLQQIL